MTARKLGRVELLRVVRIAQAIRLEQAAHRADYLAEVAADNGRGHRAHYCLHGVNLWTDYDPICGACEEFGFNGSDPLQPYYDALAIVRRESNRVASVIEALMILQREAGLTASELMDIHARSRDASTIPARFLPLVSA